MQHEARRFAEDGSTEAHMLKGTVSGVRELAAFGRPGAAHAVVLANSGSLSCCALNRCETDPCCDSDRPCCDASALFRHDRSTGYANGYLTFCRANSACLGACSSVECSGSTIAVTGVCMWLRSLCKYRETHTDRGKCCLDFSVLRTLPRSRC